MMFLIRVAFWLSLVILLLPISGPEGTGNDKQVGPMEAFGAAAAALADMRQICARQPDICSTGTAFAQKAQSAFKIVAGYATGRAADPNASKLSDRTSPASPASGESRGALSSNTLTDADRIPAWRGQPRVPAMPKHST